MTTPNTTSALRGSQARTSGNRDADPTSGAGEADRRAGTGDTVRSPGGGETVAQVRLPGQAAAPQGPVDPFMMYVMHHAFRRDLADFARSVPRTPVPDRATWQALQQRWSLFREALHHHHAGEDSWLWPLLESRCTSAEKDVLDAMEGEHGQIDPLLEACDEGFAVMAAGADGPARDALTDVLARTQDHLAAHLAHEENDALTLIQQYLSVDDWAALEKKFGEDSKLRDLFRVAPWAVKGLDEDAYRALRPRIPSPMWVIARLGSRSFDRRERRAFRYHPEAAV
ncbi:hemerythrin domain-containing protein [Gordonia sp. SID5947]|uniref:hemerythrin domain-containing protein n=1 Tax=Gordonia sp. SID5947 TaxID=2690315 RepID=UPI001371284D|nr:hemerythrin domain-containing protein [Gordonia sp. SID5947]MYR06618.1 hemerythrin domain-containing protein [Gordonia sp. SID5947]